MLNRLRHIRWQLPLSIAALLAVVVAAHSWIGYREVRRTTLNAAGERLRDVARRLSGALGQDAAQSLAAIRKTANDSTLANALAAGAPVPGEIRERLNQMLEAKASIEAIVIWDSSRTARMDVRRPDADTLPVGRAFPSWLGGDTAMVSGFFTRGDLTWYDAVVTTRRDNRNIGYLVISQRLNGSAEQAQLLTGLVGKDVTFLLGSPGGAWTNLIEIVDGPPVHISDDGMPAEYRIPERGWRLGVGMPIARTRWELWVEFSREDVLERPKTLLGHMIPLGAFIVILGAVGGWVLSRHVTVGLSDLTKAAAAISAGDYERRVPVRRPDELGALSDAFNMMAGRVHDAQQHLEQRVQERTTELLESQEQFRAIATNAQEAIITADDTGSVTYFSPGAERIFGYAAEDIQGKSIKILMPDRYHKVHERGFRDRLATGLSTVTGRTLEAHGLRHDQSEFPIELSLASWQGEGKPAFAAIIRDITRRREAEESLHRHAAELKTVNEELEAFSYSVSHDLRAPLRGIHGFSQALLEDYRDRLDAQGINYLERVCAAADRMGQLIDDLLQLAQTTRAVMRRETIDLGALARVIVQDLQATAPNRRAQFTIADELLVNGDGRLLRLALENLLGNAWKFTGKEGCADIEVGIRPQNGERRAIFVRDNGAGFDPTYADKLFHVFQRLHTPKDFPGTGIGLAIVERIVKRHGGRVWAESSVGNGATFYFTMAGL